MKIYKIILQGKEIDVIQNEDGTFNKPDIILELEKQGTATKPAHEPICMARKPLEKGLTVAENCLKYGTGGINIDESRVATEEEEREKMIRDGEYIKKRDGFIGSMKIEKYTPSSQGRFPANLIHDNSEEVREYFPETKSGVAVRRNIGISTNKEIYGDYSKRADEYKDDICFNDSGNASRFFKSIIYQAKASKSERGLSNNHPTVKPTALMEYLINMVSKENAIVLDPFGGSCTTAIACLNTKRKYICMEKDDAYYEIGLKRVLDWLKKNETNIFK